MPNFPRTVYDVSSPPGSQPRSLHIPGDSALTDTCCHVLHASLAATPNSLPSFSSLRPHQSLPASPLLCRVSQARPRTIPATVVLMTDCSSFLPLYLLRFLLIADHRSSYSSAYVFFGLLDCVCYVVVSGRGAVAGTPATAIK